MKGLYSPSILLAALLSSAMYPALAQAPIRADDYPAESLKMADALIPELADSLGTCDAKKALAVKDKILTFIYKDWNWNANYDQLKRYRVCYRMLSDIAATTQLVTNKFSSPSPYGLAGPFDADYAACRKLADPSFELKGLAISAKWPARFGSDPNGMTCNDRLRSSSQGSTAAASQ